MIGFQLFPLLLLSSIGTGFVSKRLYAANSRILFNTKLFHRGIHILANTHVNKAIELNPNMNRNIKMSIQEPKIKKSKRNSGDSLYDITSIEMRGISPLYSPRSDNQKKYVDTLNNNTTLIFAVGPAGTGKTLFACSAAIRELKQGKIQKIVITRPVVPVEEELGFLPGNIKHKMDPWTRPIFDVFLEYYSQKDIDVMVHGGVIEISPLGFMRGRTFKRCFIIADEMQNSSPNQMLMLTTRIGLGSKMVITGDLKQSDRVNDNGLKIFMEKIRNFNGNKDGIEICELENADIERSAVVTQILNIFEGKDTRDIQNDINKSPSIAQHQNITKHINTTTVNGMQHITKLPRYHPNNAGF
jgi:phosphate starvation-inducible PhoH-like protein